MGQPVQAGGNLELGCTDDEPESLFWQERAALGHGVHGLYGQSKLANVQFVQEVTRR